MPRDSQSPKRFGRDDIVRLAAMASLEISAAETEKMTLQLRDVVHYFDKLSKVGSNTTPIGTDSGPTNQLRDDLVVEFPADSILEGVPQRKGRYVKAPKAI